MAEEVPLQVLWARKAREALRQGSEGGKELARVVRTLDERLHRDPFTLGEVYRSKGAVEEHLAVHEFLAIDFAIDKERRLVLVRDA